MKLFLISQDENEKYDTYDSAVVAAPDEETARDINPANGEKIVWGTHSFAYSWAMNRESVLVEYLGEAVEGTESGVICASFNAG